MLTLAHDTDRIADLERQVAALKDELAATRAMVKIVGLPRLALVTP
jgi:hypothetical protein